MVAQRWRRLENRKMELMVSEKGKMTVKEHLVKFLHGEANSQGLLLDLSPPTITSDIYGRSTNTFLPLCLYSIRMMVVESKDQSSGAVAQSSSDSEPLSENPCAVSQRSRRQDRITVVILFCVNLLNYMDRFTIAGKVTSTTIALSGIPNMIRDYYGIDSKLLGLLQTSFVVSYMSLSPVFGYFGDRWKRKYLIVTGLVLWSVVTLASSFVPPDRFWTFLVLRCLVGVGEASYSTLAPTLLTDLFAEDSRTQVLGFFYFAVPVGSGLGFVLGSCIAESLNNWAWALRITPALGFLCILSLLFFHQDPPRGRADGAAHLHATSWWADIKTLFMNRCYLLVSFGFTGTCFVLGALSWFAVDFIQAAINARANNPREADKYNVALLFGICTCFAGLLGVVLGSFLGRKLRVFTSVAEPYVCGGGLLLSAPFVYASLLSPYFNFYLCMFFVFIGQLLICLNWALVADMTMSVVIPTRRATASALQMVLSHSLGDAISPLIIGTIADAQAHSDSLEWRYLGMQRSLFLTVFVCVVAGFLLLLSSWYLEAAKERVHFIIEASRLQCLEVEDTSTQADTDVNVVSTSWQTLNTQSTCAAVVA
ncbi:Protein spinster 3 [Sparganum proliferum]